jgi:hypothetical protein
VDHLRGGGEPDRGDRRRGGPHLLLTVQAVLLGIWFVIMGIFEIIGGFILRHELRALQRTHA